MVGRAPSNQEFLRPFQHQLLALVEHGRAKRHRAGAAAGDQFGHFERGIEGLGGFCVMLDLAHAVQALLDARRTRRWLDDLPKRARPQSEPDAYSIQDSVAWNLGPVAGWKVGSETLDSEPFRAPPVYRE